MARNFITGNSFNFNYQLQTISNEWKIIQTIGFQGTVIAENDVREDPEGEGFRKKKNRYCTRRGQYSPYQSIFKQ